jgi:hypothetical protein
MEYFKHDINASEDDKICDLLANGGYEMLGYYWRFVEYLYSRGGKIYKTKINSIAWSLHMDLSKLNQLISDFDLFCDDGEFIYSKRVLAEVEEFEAVGKRMAEIGRLGGKAKAKANAVADGKRAVSDSHSDSKANALQNKENKINKRKENKKNKENVSPLSGDCPSGDYPRLPNGEIDEDRLTPQQKLELRIF